MKTTSFKVIVSEEQETYLAEDMAIDKVNWNIIDDKSYDSYFIENDNLVNNELYIESGKLHLIYSVDFGLSIGVHFNNMNNWIWYKDYSYYEIKRTPTHWSKLPRSNGHAISTCPEDTIVVFQSTEPFEIWLGGLDSKSKQLVEHSNSWLLEGNKSLNGNPDKWWEIPTPRS